MLRLGEYDPTYVLVSNVKEDVLNDNVIKKRNERISLDQLLQILLLLSHHITLLKPPPVHVDALKFVNAILQSPLSEGVCHDANGTALAFFH